MMKVKQITINWTLWTFCIDQLNMSIKGMERETKSYTNPNTSKNNLNNNINNQITHTIVPSNLLIISIYHNNYTTNQRLNFQ